jgi:cytochrome bd ubiquinol oxidase subunit I
MEFQFGTNWSVYSRFVGDVFGSALAAEGIFAFFLESGFLAVLLFGWDRVRPGVHFFATLMVALGSVFSAVWIVVANSWQQTPAGHRLVEHAAGLRAETVDFWAVVFNPSSMERLWHTLMGAWQAGSFLVLSVSAYYLLRGRHLDFARSCMKIALWVALAGSLLQLVSGHQSARGVAHNQPAKMAAVEGHYEKSAPADMYLLGWVNDRTQRTHGLAIPGFLSFLIHGDSKAPVQGLRAFAPADRPPVNAIFQSYHLMVAIGMGLIGLTALGLLGLWRGFLFRSRWLLWLFALSVLGPAAANQLGWFTAEVGRQPWIVYGLLRTSDAASPTVSAGKITASLILFGLIYLLLFALFIFLLDHKIKHGPEDAALPAAPGDAGAGVLKVATDEEPRA